MGPRFGVWALVHGSRGTFHDPEEPFDASWERNRRLVLEAEALGFESTLIAQHTANPYDDEWDELEAWTAASALAALTTRIEIIAAIKPPLYHPVVLAKMAQQIEHISGGRFAVNLVNAWNRPEYEKAGIPFAEHDERYAYGMEWIAIVEALLRGERVSWAGRHFTVSEFQLRPADPYRSRPLIYVGGESEPAKDLVSAYGDVWFINGQSRESVARLIDSVRSRPRAGAPLRFGLSAFVIARGNHGASGGCFRAAGCLVSAGCGDPGAPAGQYRSEGRDEAQPCPRRRRRSSARMAARPPVLLGATMRWRQGLPRFTPSESRPSCCSSSLSKLRCGALPQRSSLASEG